MIFFSDLDGTFVTSDKRITAENLRALDAVAARGLEFVPCTGRCASGVPAELLAHPAVRHVVAANGAVVNAVRADGGVAPEALWRCDLGHRRARALLDMARRHGATFDLFADGRVYTARADFDRFGDLVSDPHTLALMRATRTVVEGVLEDFLDSPAHVERVSMCPASPDDAEAIRAEIAQDKSLVCVSSTPFNLEISDTGATKGAALAWLCENVGAAVADAYAFGDNINDLSMIEAAGHGVAMANALPAVKARANAVAGSCDDSGVGRFIERVLRA